MSLSVDVYNDLFISPKPFDSTSSIHELEIFMTVCLDLIKGLVIHFEDAAELSNDLVASIIPTYNANAPKTHWRYYRNMAGIYTEIDAPMYINSLDTFTRIELTVENLVDHAATRNALINNTEYRELLMSVYPDNETLLDGIINPIPVEISTKAKDGEILYYPEHLVQFNEYSLIEDLNTWIRWHMDRWYNPQYIHADELYTASYYGVMYPAMYNALLGMREDRIHTLEVHTFHVQQYLASHGLLDRHIDILTHKQRLWLYRNIRYIRKHAGHDKTFHMLVDNLLDPSHIPLDGYYMSLINAQAGIEPRFHTKTYTEEQSVGLEHHNLDSYRTLEGRSPVNQLEQSTYTLEGVEHIHSVHPIPIQYQQNDINHSVYGNLRTKILESTIIDYDEDHNYNFLNVLHDHWLYHAFKGGYSTHMDVVDLKANESMTVSVKNAYILMRVLFSEITNTPFVIRSPEVVQVLDHVDFKDYLGFADITSVKKTAEFVNFHLPALVDGYLSTTAFNTGVEEIYKGFDTIHKYMQSHTDTLTKSVLDLMINDIYQKRELEDIEFDVEKWRTETGITVDPVLMTDKEVLFSSIFSDATGYRVINKSRQEIQEGLIDYMTQLTSYGVSYNNNSKRRPVNYMISSSTHVINIINYLVTKLYVDTVDNILHSRTNATVAGSLYTSTTLTGLDNSVHKIDNRINIGIEHHTEYSLLMENNFLTLEVLP